MAYDYIVNLEKKIEGTAKGKAGNFPRGNVNDPYRFYFDDKLLPITPASWNYEAKNQNEIIHMFNGTEVSWIKRNGLGVCEFKDGLRDPDEMMNYLKGVKRNKKTIQFVVTDGWNQGIVNEKVTLEDWSVDQDSENCNDYVFSVTLQEYHEWHNMEADIDLNHHLILAKYAKGWRT